MKINSNILRYSAAFLAAAALSLGQPQPDSSKAIPLSKVERKGKAPVSSEVLRVKLPKATEFKLDDGLTVMVMEDHRLPTVTVRLIISGAGALNEPADLPGLASLTASMLKEGTTTRTSKQVAEDMEKLGATISVSAPYGSNAATLFASGLSDNFGQWLALAADIVLHPTFPESELDKLKQRLKVQLQQQRSSPFFLIRERFNRAVYGNHPAAITSPTPESIEKITPKLLAKWHHDRYAPQNAILGIAGDVRAADLASLFEGLPPWDATDAKIPEAPPTKPVSGRKIFLVDRPGSVQTDVFIGNIAVTRTDADYMPMVVMDRIVGGGASARLFLNLREEHGYTYGAYSQLIARKYAGPWIAQGNMRTDATAGSLTEFMNEINRIRKEAVPERELEENKRSIVASFALSLEDPSQLLDYAMDQKLFGLPADYWDTYPAKIMNTTAEQVQRVAGKYLVPDDLQIAVVGDASKIKPVLEKYGPVEVYDTNGKKK
ncbi:MAG TPA: pitrilysin family protein [Bryobacteraceae bacterium]|nr:pitrilysin family protein [Bryobacteraceae bacterium]